MLSELSSRVRHGISSGRKYASLADEIPQVRVAQFGMTVNRGGIDGGEDANRVCSQTVQGAGFDISMSYFLIASLTVLSGICPSSANAFNAAITT